MPKKADFLRRSLLISTFLLVLGLFLKAAFSTVYGNWDITSDWIIGPYWDISASADVLDPYAMLMLGAILGGVGVLAFFLITKKKR